MDTILEYIHLNAEIQPDKKAISASDGDLTYSQLWDKITGTAVLLKKQGLKFGDRILIEASHTAEYVVLSFAVQLIGAIHVTLEHNAPVSRAEEVAELTQCAFSLTGAHPFEALKASFADVSGEEWTDGFPPGSAVQEIMFTTGTTGTSKGVVLTHSAALFRCLAQIRGFEFKRDMILLIPSPMNHAAALRRTQLSFVNGSTVVLIDGFMNLKLFFDTIESGKVDSIYLPPAGVHYILTLAAKKLASIGGQIKAVFSSSSVLSLQDKTMLNEILPGAKKYDVYGSSESGPASFTEYGTSEIKTGCVGTPFPGYEIFTVDENYKPYAATKDNPGIIAISGKGLADSYWNEPELSEKTFRDGIIYMTDMGYFESGKLVLVGRRDDVINIGGLKVAPIEVEEAALKFEAVNECACLAHKDRMLGDIVRIFVSAREGFEIDDAELLGFMGSVLEAYKLPKRIVHLEELPHTYNGKIDRKKLLSM